MYALLDVHFSLFTLFYCIAHSLIIWEVFPVYLLSYKHFVSFPHLPLGFNSQYSLLTCFSPTSWMLYISGPFNWFLLFSQACLANHVLLCYLTLYFFVGEPLPHFQAQISFYCMIMSSDQTSAKPRSSKCRHNLHNYSPTCRESGKGDDLCVTNQAPCNICKDLSAEQHAKNKNRRWYTQK